MAKKIEEYSSFTIEERGKGNLCAIMHLTSPRLELDGPPTRMDVFNENSLARRVDKLESEGIDAGVSKDALASLRAQKAELAPS